MTQDSTQEATPVTTPVTAPEAKTKRKGRKPRGVSMNRCTSCGKFVSLEPGEPEDQGLTLEVEKAAADYEHEVHLNGSVRLTLNCADCSDELAETTVEFDESWTITHEGECEDPEMETQGPDLEQEEDSEGSGMYSKHFYGARATFEVSCPICGVKLEGESTQLEQASSFEVTG